MSDFYDYHNLLLQSQSSINKKNQKVELQILAKQKNEQLLEVQKQYTLKIIANQIYNQRQQEVYECKLQSNINILMYQNINISFLNYNFPKTQAKFFVQNNLTHPFIDSQTWQINVEWKNNLLETILEIENKFVTSNPEGDLLLENMNNELKEKNFEQLLKNIENADLRTVYSGVQPAQFKQLVESQESRKYILQLNDSQEASKQLVNICNFIKVLSSIKFYQTKADVSEFIKRNEQLKLQLKENAIQFEQLKTEANSASMQCDKINKIYEPKELQKVLDRKIYDLEFASTDKYDNIERNQNQEIGQKDFEIDYKEFLEIRKKYQFANIKKDKLVSQFYQNKY